MTKFCENNAMFWDQKWVQCGEGSDCFSTTNKVYNYFMLFIKLQITKISKVQEQSSTKIQCKNEAILQWCQKCKEYR